MILLRGFYTHRGYWNVHLKLYFQPVTHFELQHFHHNLSKCLPTLSHRPGILWNITSKKKTVIDPLTSRRNLCWSHFGGITWTFFKTLFFFNWELFSCFRLKWRLDASFFVFLYCCCVLALCFILFEKMNFNCTVVGMVNFGSGNWLSSFKLRSRDSAEGIKINDILLGQ